MVPSGTKGAARLTPMSRRTTGLLAFAAVALACGQGTRGETMFTPTPGTTTSASSPTDADADDAHESTASGSSEEDPTRLDVAAAPAAGCEAIDFLFVIDNSESMETYQVALTRQFPDFITAMYAALRPDIDIHVGLTTTDFDAGCDASEATLACQSTATREDVEAHYKRPDAVSDGGNGTQGRLFRWAGRDYFETTSSDDPTALGEWFAQAAIAAGEDGCSFEMPVAAAGFVAHPANAGTNAGFLRDERALLVVFFLTDEPDKSPESKTLYADMLLEAKAACGGADCIFVSGLIPACTIDVNQKLWQFAKLFGDDDPPWGNIEIPSRYGQEFGNALATAIAEACDDLPEP